MSRESYTGQLTRPEIGAVPEGTNSMSHLLPFAHWVELTLSQCRTWRWNDTLCLQPAGTEEEPSASCIVWISSPHHLSAMPVPLKWITWIECFCWCVPLSCSLCSADQLLFGEKGYVSTRCSSGVHWASLSLAESCFAGPPTSSLVFLAVGSPCLGIIQGSQPHEFWVLKGLSLSSLSWGHLAFSLKVEKKNSALKGATSWLFFSV